MNKIEVGLVLGGGGARGFFHIGVIKALQELNITVKEISGNSVGALIGATYANNPTSNFDEIITNTNFTNLAKVAYKNLRLISFKSLEKYIKNLVKAQTFSDLKIPLSFSAIDINSGKEVIFRKGDLFPPLSASMAIPGIFPLVEHNKQILCDGGLINNVPVNLIQQKNLPLIISDIRIQTNKIDPNSSKIKIMKNAYLIPRNKIMDENIDTIKKNRKTIYLEFHKHHHVLNFRKTELQQMVEIGYAKTMEQKKQLLNLIK